MIGELEYFVLYARNGEILTLTPDAELEYWPFVGVRGELYAQQGCRGRHMKPEDADKVGCIE